MTQNIHKDMSIELKQVKIFSLLKVINCELDKWKRLIKGTIYMFQLIYILFSVQIPTYTYS